MLFLRNKEKLERGQPDAQTTEYQVIADSHIVGELHYGPYYFTIWEFGNMRPGEDRWLCLRVSEDATDRSEQWKIASKEGFYHGGGIASELVALSCLFLRRRLKLGPVVRMGDSPRMFSSDRPATPKYLTGGSSNLAELGQWLHLVEGLKPELHEPFILAVKLYQEAIDLLHSKADLAYLNLVSSIEVLAQNFPIEKPPTKEFDAALAALLERIPDNSLRREIEDAISSRERFIAKRFVSFILSHVGEEFWDYPERPEHGRIAPDQLPELLRRIYRQRSRTLHAGEPFPPAMTWTAEELPTGLAMSVGERRWDKEDFIPAVPFFERLVNHVLKSFLQTNQA